MAFGGKVLAVWVDPVGVALAISVPVYERHVVVFLRKARDLLVYLLLLRLGDAYVNQVHLAVAACLYKLLHGVVGCGHVGEGVQDYDVSHYALVYVALEHLERLVGPASDVAVQKAVWHVLLKVPVCVACNGVCDYGWDVDVLLDGLVGGSERDASLWEVVGALLDAAR